MNSYFTNTLQGATNPSKEILQTCFYQILQMTKHTKVLTMDKSNNVPNDASIREHDLNPRLPDNSILPPLSGVSNPSSFAVPTRAKSFRRGATKKLPLPNGQGKQSQSRGEIKPFDFPRRRNRRMRSNQNSNHPSSKKRFFSKKKSRDEDDQSALSGLSYSTPIISNTTAGQHRTRSGDGSSDVTPTISNLLTMRDTENKLAAATDAISDKMSVASDKVSVASDKASEASGRISIVSDEAVRSSSGLEKNRSSGGTSVFSDVTPLASNLREPSNNERNVARNGNEGSVESRNLRQNNIRNNLFRISSGRIPDQLQSKNPSPTDGLTPNSSTGDLSKNDRRSIMQSKSTEQRNRSSNSLLSRSCDSIHNDITNLRREMDGDDEDDNKLVTVADRFHSLLPFIICILFFVQLLLSSYASLSCRFITCNIGFEPLNVNFQQSTLDFGLWSFYAKTKGGEMKCLSYPNDFITMFITDDSAWLASRSIGIINIFIGFFVFMVICTLIGQKSLEFVRNSSKSKFFLVIEKRWKDICLFCTVVLLLWESVKFVFTRIEICSKDKWMNSSGEMVSAEGCSLSKGGICTIFAILFDAAIIILLVISCRPSNSDKQPNQVSDDMVPLNDEDQIDAEVGSDTTRMKTVQSASQRSLTSGTRPSGSNRNLNGSNRNLNGSNRHLDSNVPRFNSFRSRNDSLRSLGDDSMQENPGEYNAENSGSQRQLFANANGGGSQRNLRYMDSSTKSLSVGSNLGGDELKGSWDNDHLSDTGENNTINNNNNISTIKEESDEDSDNYVIRNQRPMVRSSIGFYANSDDSLSMPTI
jgi:hypothetical protein